VTFAKKPESRRQSLRDQARERRLALMRRREALLDMAASGYSTQTIAAQFGLTAGQVRRQYAAAVAARKAEAPDHFVHLQIARLHKALRAAEAAVDRIDLRGIDGIVKIVAALDKYHLPAFAAPPMQAALPAPLRAPLALAHEPARETEA
jgi:DNA-binding CsgD family transcriptional regulator